jgi:hypothetical protein
MDTLNVTTKVKNYDGNNYFINSLKLGLSKYGKLTPKQLIAADNFFSKLETPKVEVSNQPINGNIVISQPENKERLVNVNIKVTKFVAKNIAEKNKLDFRPFLITVSKVVSETSKSYQLVGRMTTSDVTSCRCCGLDLTDWRSQATGVGPVCSKNLGIPYVKNKEDIEVFKKMLQLKINQIGDLTFWVAKSQIVEGLNELK